jgi:hypothetical protein
MPQPVPYRIVDSPDGLRAKWVNAEPTDFRNESVFGVVEHLLSQSQQATNACAETDANELFKLAEQRRDFAPSRFIYHVSRCGSTLLSNMLASVPGNITLNEPTIPCPFLNESIPPALLSAISPGGALRASLAALHRPTLQRMRARNTPIS